MKEYVIQTKGFFISIKTIERTHAVYFRLLNANIPVLGDSEMLVACQYVPDNEIKIECGSIDCQNIQGKNNPYYGRWVRSL